MTDVEHISRKGTGVPVSWFPMPEESELSENLRGPFRKARETVGFVPNVFRAYSFSRTTASSTSRRRTWTRQSER